jgi:hypothetical protein
MKNRFRAILKVNGKETAFAKSGETIQNVIDILKEEGISFRTLVRIEPFKVSVEKQRGRTPRKY